MKTHILRYIQILIVTIFIASCGGGGGSDDNAVLTGSFVDSEVEGLRWVSGDLSGTTDTAGSFQYIKGDTVQFFLGDILIGEATGSSVLIPVDLVAGAADITNPTVTNIIRFLLSLDNDADPSNGIEINQATIDLSAGEAIDFTLSTGAFEASTDVQNFISALAAITTGGSRTLTNVVDAQAHATNSISELIAGTYSGTHSGDAPGTWAGTVTALGIFTGSTGDETFAGTVSFDGSGTTSFTSGGVSDGTTFMGSILPNGSASGTWNYENVEFGTWRGSKTN